MTQPDMPSLPGFDAMADTLEFVKKMWGDAHASTGIPGMVMPTLSLDEVNKQISDLKAVESWLSVNMNMLRSTIQALEVQGATLSSLHAMGTTAFDADAHAAPVSHAGTRSDDPARVAGAAGVSAEWWNLLQEQFNQTVRGVMAEETGARKKKAEPAMDSGKPSATAAKKTVTKSGLKPGKKPDKNCTPPAKP